MSTNQNTQKIKWEIRKTIPAYNTSKHGNFYHEEKTAIMIFLEK